MAFGTLEGSEDEVMNEINMTPLVDIMLVLLIIFIITVPVMKDSVNINLPIASNEPEDLKPEIINLSITENGVFHWNKEAISDEEFVQRLVIEAKKESQPDLHLYGDKEVKYERIAVAMAMAQKTGIKKIGFITEPEN